MAARLAHNDAGRGAGFPRRRLARLQFRARDGAAELRSWDENRSAGATQYTIGGASCTAPTQEEAAAWRARHAILKTSGQ